MLSVMKQYCIVKFFTLEKDAHSSVDHDIEQWSIIILLQSFAPNASPSDATKLALLIFSSPILNLRKRSITLLPDINTG